MKYMSSGQDYSTNNSNGGAQAKLSGELCEIF